MHGEAQGCRACRGKSARAEAFENVKLFQDWEENAAGQKGQREPSDRRRGERSGPLISMSRRSSGGAYRRRRPIVVGSHTEIPSAVGSGEGAQSLSAGKENRSETLDLVQDHRQSLDLQKLRGI
jgi:hypothetical protein